MGEDRGCTINQWLYWERQASIHKQCRSLVVSRWKNCNTPPQIDNYIGARIWWKNLTPVIQCHDTIFNIAIRRPPSWGRYDKNILIVILPVSRPSLLGGRCVKNILLLCMLYVCLRWYCLIGFAVCIDKCELLSFSSLKSLPYSPGGVRRRTSPLSLRLAGG